MTERACTDRSYRDNYTPIYLCQAKPTKARQGKARPTGSAPSRHQGRISCPAALSSAPALSAYGLCKVASDAGFRSIAPSPVGQAPATPETSMPPLGFSLSAEEGVWPAAGFGIKTCEATKPESGASVSKKSRRACVSAKCGCLCGREPPGRAMDQAVRRLACRPLLPRRVRSTSPGPAAAGAALPAISDGGGQPR